MSGKVKYDDEHEEKPALRRSSRATRGSVKPLVDLTREEEQDGEQEQAEATDDEVTVVKPSRRSAAKPAPAKKSSIRQNSTKRVPSKPDETVTKVKEESQLKTTKGTALDEDDTEEAGLVYELNEKEMKEINNAFDLNRISDEDELLNADGLRTAMRSLGFEPRGDEIKRLIRKFSATNKGGKVNRDGFHKIMAFKYSTTPTMRCDRANDEISRVFDLLDLDKTGLITLENLSSIAKELNEELTQEDLLEMIMEADLDGDSKINKEEFHNIMKKTSLY